MLEIGLRTKLVACSISLLIGWWLVPSKVTISNETHRFLPGELISLENCSKIFIKSMFTSNNTKRAPGRQFSKVSRLNSFGRYRPLMTKRRMNQKLMLQIKLSWELIFFKRL